MTASPGRPPRVLIIVENLPVPFDRRVWSEATTLRRAGYEVSVICPTGVGYDARHEEIDGIRVYRHPLPAEGVGAWAYVREYGTALAWEFWLALRIWRRQGFDVIHACNPPDLIVVVGAFFKFLMGKRFVFDHHDINPEFYEVKFGRRDILWRLLCFFERLTFAVADISIATNESYRQIAIDRGRMKPDRVFVVRSGPNLKRLHRVDPNPQWKHGRQCLVAYVGVIGEAEGIDLLLDAAAHVVAVREHRDIQFIIIGSGPQLNNLRKLCANKHLDDFVTFTGRVDESTLREILSTADIGVNPDRASPYNDKSTMNKIMEYMAFALPIVQFDHTEGRFSSRDASLYARPDDTEDLGDKIIELAGDADSRRTMGAFGRRRVVEELSWEHEEPKLLAAYDALFLPEG